MPTAEFDRFVAGDPAAADAAIGQGGQVNVSATWRSIGRPVLASDAGDAWALGASAAERAASLTSLQAPDFTLADLDGNPHTLSDYRGKKIFLATWASW